MERAPVDLVRVPREERYFDREEVLGRDAASVFPKAARRAAAGPSGTNEDGSSAPSLTPLADAEALKQSLGARRFISETELDEVRASRGKGSVEDGAVSVDKPLVEVLREAKAAKEADFAAKWKTMKTGKNRPLDPEELDFLDGMLQQEREKDRQWSQQQREELYAFRQAVQEKDTAEDAAAAAAESADPFSTSSASAAPSATSAVSHGPEPAPKALSKRPAAAPMVRPLMTIKRKTAPPPASPLSLSVGAAVTTHPSQNPVKTQANSCSEAAGQSLGGGSSCKGPEESKAQVDEGPAALSLTQDDKKIESPGLGGLFAGYGSDSDDEGEG